MAVFELAWEHISNDEPIGLPWLYRCARNVVGNEYQRRKRSQKLALRLVSDYVANALIMPTERDPQLVEAVKRLPLADRELIAMVYWYDLSLREAAGIIGVSEASIKMRLSRIRKKLRSMIDSPRNETTREGATHGRP